MLQYRLFEVYRKEQRKQVGEICVRETARATSVGLMYYHVYADQVQSPSQDGTGYEPALSGTEDISTGSPKSSRNTARHMCFHLKVTCMGRTRMLKSQDVYEHLFERDGSEECALYPVVVVGATAMQQKLCSYAWKQLPGGIYWDPEPSVREILAQLKPTNDVVESTLGLNDYLTTAVPNLHQMARSNLVEVKKNKSQHSATKGTGRGIRSERGREKQNVFKENKQAVQRRSNMEQAYTRTEALKNKAREEKEQLLQKHLISSIQELFSVIAEIENESISTSKKRPKKFP